MTRPPARCGTESGYAMHGRRGEPRCDACRDAHRAYTIEYRRNRTRLRVPPATVRGHLLKLIERGMPRIAIAADAGINHATITRILNGRATYIYRDTAQRILAVRYRPGRLVDANGTRRRLEALAALGWPLVRIGAMLDVSHDRVRQYLTQPYVYAETAVRVRELYDRLSMTPGPSRRVARRARRLGYIPPLGWDEDIDDPGAWANVADETDVVDDVVVDHLCHGKDWREIGATPAERRAAAERLDRTRAASRADIERRLGLRWGRDVTGAAA